MTASREVLFIQGAGEGTHDAWDDKLVGSLQRELGDGFDVRYPRMPHEDAPSVAAWVPAVRREVDALRDGAVAVGHSIGGTILIHVLAGHAPAARLAAIVLVAAPFVGAGGWPGDEFELRDDLEDRLPPGVPVHVVQGLDDETAPALHAHRYARAIPRARIPLLPGRDHQLGNDLREVAGVILATSRRAGEVGPAP